MNASIAVKRQAQKTTRPALKSKTARSRYQKRKERKLFYEQYNIYGQYVAQEEKDIDRAIKNLDNLIRTIQ